MANKKENAMILMEEIIQGIENVKGESIQKMDLRKIENTPFEFFVICSGNSNTQVETRISSVFFFFKAIFMECTSLKV